jgi:hypothetical protein
MANPHAKGAQRAHLATLMAIFIANGGKITPVRGFRSANRRPANVPGITYYPAA